MTNKWISRRECLLLFKKNKEEKEGRREKKQEWEKERERMNLLFIYVNGLAHKKNLP